MYSAAFLGHQERKFSAPPVPILRSEEWDRRGFETWFIAHRPDVLVFHQTSIYLAAALAVLARLSVRVPRGIGVALLDKNPDPKRYSGICQDPKRMGMVALEMLLGRMLLNDVSAVDSPKIELVVGRWNDGATLRSVARRRGSPAGCCPSAPRRG